MTCSHMVSIYVYLVGINLKLSQPKRKRETTKLSVSEATQASVSIQLLCLCRILRYRHTFFPSAAISVMHVKGRNQLARENHGFSCG